ncbi:hypothetical protein EZ428_23830 [Pedobacter frigiditerrae]|uniref:Uncharacterized protein n=1 Tax=Pedobacter frigiditerrae TaxID=2530452 RepID=A0A4V2MHG7_9SPHI|nr:hypothetical protein [Pedobacter frigiditerrae]TCC86496.1 hypothetical protein EZ428_23830 [Pedobacter frigiditerrae]
MNHLIVALNKRLLFLAAAISITLSACLTNNFQHRKYYNRTATGVITEIYRNNLGGNTIVLDGKVNINVWDEDLDSTMVIGNVKTFQFKLLGKSVRK